MPCSIYIIKNETNQRYYIGLSCSVKRRILEHMSALRNNRHKNDAMQEDYNAGHKFNTLVPCTADRKDDPILLDYLLNNPGSYNTTHVIEDLTPQQRQRFHDSYYLDSSGCYIWKGDNPVFRWNHKEHMAARVSYRLHHKNIGDGLIIGHTCSNPKCVNPSHLYLKPKGK